MSVFDIINLPIQEARELLGKYSAELRPTKFPDTYIIKFNPRTQANHPAVNQLRGLIYNAETLDIYSMGYPVPLEFKDQGPESQQQVIDGLHARGYTVQEALDGTLLRLWFHPETDQWVLSTNGVEDANEAYWMNGISFGSLFTETLQGLFANLNKDHVYLFSLCHPLNVIVVNHTAPRIYHVATYDRLTHLEVPCDLGIEHPPVLDLTVEQVLANVSDSLTKPVTSAGYLIVQQPDADGVVRRFRFENSNYTKARALRGNSNEINLTILGHLLAKDQTNLKEFLLYYPIYQANYDHLSSCLDKLASILYSEYGMRFKRHANIFVHPLHHRILFEIHQLYTDHFRSVGQTIQLLDIKNFMLQQSADRLNQLLATIADSA